MPDDSFARAPYRLCGVLLAASLSLPAALAGERDGTEWSVSSGDTLYQIARSIYPGNATKQSRLRQDIMLLNPANFSGGIRLQPGDVLQLPRYVVDPTATTDSVKPLKPVQSVQPVQPAKVQPAATPPVVSNRGGWVVKRGETLFSIGRAIYPGDLQKQSILRRDIVKLNRTAFANGADKLAVGTRLTLPNYVDLDAPASTTATAGATTQATTAQPVKQEPAVKAQKAPEPTPPAPEPEAVASEMQSAPEPEQPADTTTTRRARDETGGPSDGNFFIGLGLGYGGDEIVEVDGGFDITGGSGINLRLGYQSLPAHGSGYRAALGLQYHAVKDATLRDSYLQLAYQYRADPLIYGIGLVAHRGAEVEDADLDFEFDPAAGLFVYLEGSGDSSLAGWGLSLTSLEIEEKDTGDEVDASSLEIYYSWHF